MKILILIFNIIVFVLYLRYDKGLNIFITLEELIKLGLRIKRFWVFLLIN